MKTVQYFDTVFEADVARGRLESEGLRAVVLNENIGSAIPVTLANPAMRPYVAVADEDYEHAVELLGVCDESESAVCPACGSCRVKYGFAGRDGRKRAIKIMFVLLSLAGGGYVGNLRSVRYCEECGQEF